MVSRYIPLTVWERSLKIVWGLRQKESVSCSTWGKSDKGVDQGSHHKGNPNRQQLDDKGPLTYCVGKADIAKERVAFHQWSRSVCHAANWCKPRQCFPFPRRLSRLAWSGKRGIRQKPWQVNYDIVHLPLPLLTWLRREKENQRDVLQVA